MSLIVIPDPDSIPPFAFRWSRIPIRDPWPTILIVIHAGMWKGLGRCRGQILTLDSADP